MSAGLYKRDLASAEEAMNNMVDNAEGVRVVHIVEVFKNFEDTIGDLYVVPDGDLATFREEHDDCQIIDTAGINPSELP